MAIADTRGVPGSYNEKLAALLETEAQMGERAALLADIADALSHFSDTVKIGATHLTFADRKIDAAEWPTFRDLGLLLRTWREQRTAVDAMWDAMSAEERSLVNAPPFADGTDPTRAWI